MVFKPRCDIWQYFDNIVAEGIAVCKFCKQRLKNYSSYVLRRHIQKLHNPNSEVWKYFDNIEGTGLAACKQCKHRVRTNRSFNLQQHLQFAHNILVTNIEGGFVLQQSTNDQTEQEANNDNEQSEENSTTCSEVQEILEELKPKVVRENILPLPMKNILYIDNMDEKKLMSAMWGLMLDDGVAPTIFGSKNMQSLIEPICKAISTLENKDLKIDVKETEKLLDLATKYLHNDFSSNLNFRLLSLAIDMDVQAPSNTYCLSTSFVHNEIVEKRVLGIIDLKNDLQLTEKHIKDILNKYNIEDQQIINITCDFSKTNYNKQVENHEYLKEILDFEQFPQIRFANIKIEPYIGVLAQLCLLDIFKNSQILQPFLKCRTFVKFINDPANDFAEVFEQNFLNLPIIDSPWRWGTTYNMINDLQQARNVLSDIQNISAEYEFQVDENMWQFIEAFCECIKLMQKAITRYYTEEMHFGDFYALWLKTKLLTEKLASKANTENPYSSIILKELQNCLEKRSKEILNRDYFKACLYLDPRFQHTLQKEEKLKAIEYLNMLWKDSKNYNPDVLNTATDILEVTANSKSFEDEEDALLNQFLVEESLDTDARTHEVYSKIERLKMPFKPVHTNILKFWHNLQSSEPVIYALTNICFAIPTTQIFNKNRYSHIYKTNNIPKVSPLMKDKLVSIRLNAHVVQNALEPYGLFYENQLSKDDHKIVENNEAVN